MSTGAEVDVRLPRTDELGAGARAEVRALLAGAFAADWTESDWEHCLGGVHALVEKDGVLVGHGAVVRRRLRHRGRAVRAGYVEGLAVRRDRRGRRIGAALMGRIEAVIRGALELGALNTTDAAAGFYAARGWRSWRGRASVFTPQGIEPTREDDDAVRVFPVTADLDLDGELTCDWRAGDPW